MVVALTAKPGPGWVFDRWEGDINGLNNPETIVMNSYKNVTAVFTQLPANQYTLWIDKKGLGGVRLQPPGGVYYKGTSVVITVFPDDGWGFKGWSGDLTGADTSKKVCMNSDFMISAEFIEIEGTQYTLALTDIE